jgi:uncharacterized protein (DUF433 family)
LLLALEAREDELYHPSDDEWAAIEEASPSTARRWRLVEAMKQPIVSRNLDVMGGTAVFHGTRVPVQTLLDYLEAGETIDDFLDGFPSVTREHVIAFLEEAKDRVIEAAS